MSIFLWILQIVLALMFLGIGTQRLTRPAHQLRRLPWTEGYSSAVIRVIGAVELLAGLGLLVPWMTHWLPALTPVAACGVAVLMCLAISLHLRRREPQALTLPAILLVMALAVALGRFSQLA